MGVSKKFSVIVRKRRQKLGLSQEELAEKAEIDRTYVSLIERGKRTVTINVAERIAVALGMSLSRLFRKAESQT